MDRRRTAPTLVGLLVVVSALPFAIPAAAVSPDVVISQVYGGGGNSSAPYRNDFIELFNRGSVAVNLAGWSVQYATATGTTWEKTDLTAFTLQPGQYFLVHQAAGTGCSGVACGAALPAADTTGTIAMNSTGKLALVANSTLIDAGTCPVGASGVRDFLGWGGTATCFETETATAGTNLTAVVRRDRCADTDNNQSDFEQLGPDPRNMSTTVAPCSGPPPATPDLSVDDVSRNEGDSGTKTFSFTVSLTSAAPAGGVSFDVSTADDSAEAPDDYTSKSLAGQAIPAGATSYSFEVAVNGDSTFESDETFLVRVANVTGANVDDDEGVGTIENDDEALVAPVVKSLTGPADAVRVASKVGFEAAFADENSSDTHTTTWDWGDGSPPTTNSPTGSDTASHEYSSAGFYTVTFTVTDQAGQSDVGSVRVIVYDPDAGHVTGGGNFAADVSFDLMAAYKSSGDNVTGELNLSGPGVSFHSTSVSWLVVSGPRATYKGVGTLNGEDGCSFLVSLTDGGSPGSKDRVRLRVKNAAGEVVFDTQPGDPFDAAPTTRPSGGNVTVHKDTTATADKR